jgi:hypothetical protein
MHCDVIKDLLPLYAEGLASGESGKLVEEHLTGCPGCREALEGLKTALPDEESPALPLKKISRGIKRRRIRTALLVLFLLLAFVTSAFSAFTTPRYAPYTEHLFSIREIRVEDLLAGEITQNTLDILAKAGILNAAAEAKLTAGDGQLIRETLLRYGGRESELPDTLLELTFNLGYGAGLSYTMPSEGEDGGIQVFDLEIYSYPFARVDHQGETKLYTAVQKGKKAAVFYLEPDRPDRLVYGPNPIPDGGRMTLPRLALAYYVMMSLALAALIAIVLFILRKKEKPRRVLTILLGLPLSWVTGHLLIKGFTNESWEMLRDMAYILITAAFLFAAWMVYWLGKPDKRINR